MEDIILDCQQISFDLNGDYRLDPLLRAMTEEEIEEYECMVWGSQQLELEDFLGNT